MSRLQTTVYICNDTRSWPETKPLGLDDKKKLGWTDPFFGLIFSLHTRTYIYLFFFHATQTNYATIQYYRAHTIFFVQNATNRIASSILTWTPICRHGGLDLSSCAVRFLLHRGLQHRSQDGSVIGIYLSDVLGYIAGSSLNALDLAGNTPISCRLELCYSHARDYAATYNAVPLQLPPYKAGAVCCHPRECEREWHDMIPYHTTPHHTIRQVSCMPLTPRSLSWSRSTQRMAQSVPLQPRQTWCSRLMLPMARCEWQRVWPIFTYHVLIERPAIPDL